MDCPPECARLLSEILYWSLLSIRGHGNNGDAKTCAILADHAHNLPSLIEDFSPEQLRYYWDCERRGLIQNAPLSAESFEGLWDELRPHVERLAPPDRRSDSVDSRGGER